MKEHIKELEERGKAGQRLREMLKISC